MIHKKIPWEELLPAQQILLLQWMIDGLHQSCEMFIKQKAYRALVESVHKGEKFSPQALWNSLPENTQSHFEHSKDIMILLEQMIDDAREKILSPKASKSIPVPLPPKQPDPPAEKPRQKSSKRGGKK
jgi:hypothetical protein